MPIQKTDALVLKREDLRETSLLACFYTRSFGKMSGVLKGIREEPSKFASTLEPFSLNELVFYEKKASDLHIVSQCDLKDNFTPLRQNIVKVAAASLMMEFLNTVMPVHEPNLEVFDLTASCLKELETTFNPDKITTIFKIKMLALSGFKPTFDSCVSCGERISGQSKFSLALGGLLCPSCYRKDLRSRSIFRGTVASILHIEKNDFRSNLNLGMNPQIKKELDLVLNSFLNFHLEKEFKSQKVLNKLAVAV